MPRGTDAQGVRQVRFACPSRTRNNQVPAFFYPVAGDKPFNCRGIKPSVRFIDSFVQVGLRIFQCGFFEEPAELFIEPQFPFVIDDALKALEAQKTEAENLEIVQMVRALRMTPAQLSAMLSGGTVPGSLADDNNEQEENSYEE